MTDCCAIWSTPPLDLEEVKLVDQDAVRFLARCEAAGARLEGCAPYVREWITREEDQGSGHVERPAVLESTDDRESEVER